MFKTLMFKTTILVLSTLIDETNYNLLKLKIMKTITVPTRDQVSPTNQGIFDNLQKGLGFVPNLYATFALSETALADYLALQNRKSTLTGKEREIINLVTSQVNECLYCLSAHTALGKMNGFTDEQIMELRSGQASFNAKYDALAKFVKSAVVNRTKPEAAAVQNFFQAGYTEANLVDAIIIIGDKVTSNLLHGATQIPVDFPLAQPLQSSVVA